MMSNYCVYIHINKINKKVYIGLTNQRPQDRWKNGNGYSNQVFGRAIEKYGWDNFEHFILFENLSLEEANQQEQFLIQLFDSTNLNKGYNQTTGGTCFSHLSEQAKQKISMAWTEERKNKLTERNKTYFQNNPDKRVAQQALMSHLNKTLDRTGSNNSMFGRDRSGANAGNKRKIRCIETQEIFDTVTDASKWCNNGKATLKSHIAQQIKGERKSCGKHPITGVPLHWEYVDEIKETNINEN